MSPAGVHAPLTGSRTSDVLERSGLFSVPPPIASSRPSASDTIVGYQRGSTSSGSNAQKSVSGSYDFTCVVPGPYTSWSAPPT